MDIGKLIKVGLRKKDISQVKLANILGVRPPSVAAWVSGKSSPTAEKLIEIIKILDLVEEFFPEYGKKLEAGLHSVDTTFGWMGKRKKLDDELDSIEAKFALLEKRLKLLEKASSED